MLLYTSLSYYITTLSYLGIFLWFAVLEQLTPVPEEVYLMSTGYIAAHISHLNIYLCGAAALTGLLACDNILFCLSLKGNKLAGKLLDKLSMKLSNRVKQNLNANTTQTLFISALIPKLRFFSPLIAGAMNVPWRKFLLANASATAFYVTVYLAFYFTGS